MGTELNIKRLACKMNIYLEWVVVKSGIWYDKGKVTFGHSKGVANAKKEMNAPKGKDRILAIVFQSKPEGESTKFRQRVWWRRWMVLNVRFTAMLRTQRTWTAEGMLLRRLHWVIFEGSTENSAVRKYLPYLSKKKSTNIFWATIMN